MNRSTIDFQVIFKFLGSLSVCLLTSFFLLVGAKAAFSNNPDFHVKGWVSLVLGIGILIATVDRWVNLMPGLLFLAAFNGFLTSWTGKLVNNPSISVPRDVAIVGTILLVASGFLTTKYVGRPLGVSDRVALLSFVGCFLWSAVTSDVVVPLSVGVVAVSMAWIRDDVIQSIKKRSRSS